MCHIAKQYRLSEIFPRDNQIYRILGNIKHIFKYLSERGRINVPYILQISQNNISKLSILQKKKKGKKTNDQRIFQKYYKTTALEEYFQKKNILKKRRTNRIYRLRK